jgi:hypothetical protein
MAISLKLSAAGVLALAVLAFAGPYTPDLTWPTSIPKGAAQFTAMALDTTQEEGLVYVAQRSTAFPQPILAFSKEGDFKFAWGNTSISRAGSSWGVHGMTFQVRFPICDRADIPWISLSLTHTRTHTHTLSLSECNAPAWGWIGGRKVEKERKRGYSFSLSLTHTCARPPALARCGSPTSATTPSSSE